MGNPSPEKSLDFTKKVCDIFENELSIPKDNLYLTLTPVEGYHWGWNDLGYCHISPKEVRFAFYD